MFLQFATTFIIEAVSKWDCSGCLRAAGCVFLNENTRVAFPSLLGTTAAGRVILAGRIGTLSLRKQLFRGARVCQHVQERVVALLAPAFVHHVRLIGVLPQFLDEGERFDPRRWIFSGNRNLQILCVDSLVVLNQVQVFARTAKVCLVSEIRDTSTTKVSPSHRPMESPQYWRTSFGRWALLVIGITRSKPVP